MENKKFDTCATDIDCSHWGNNIEFEFTEWVGLHYLRMNKVWCHKFRDQRDKKNWKTTDELYKLFKSNKP